MNNKKLVNIVFILAFIGATGIFYITTQDKKIRSNSTNSMSLEESSSPSFAIQSAEPSMSPNNIQSIQETTIQVYVCGAIVSPAVYEMSVTARVVDVVEAAGGFTEDANKIAVNLAKQVSDGEQIYIPSIDEEIALPSISSQDNPTGGKININTATLEELMTLPGIGQAKAVSIITYRETSGRFQTIEDIMNIEGIKEGVYQKIKDMITVR